VDAAERDRGRDPLAAVTASGGRSDETAMLGDEVPYQRAGAGKALAVGGLGRVADLGAFGG
jgi:hypothetical protein